MAQNVSTPDIGMTKSQRKEVSTDFRGYFVQQRRKSLTNCDHSSATTSPVHHNNLPGICYRYHPHSGVGVGGSGGQNWMKKRWDHNIGSVFLHNQLQHSQLLSLLCHYHACTPQKSPWKMLSVSSPFGSRSGRVRRPNKTENEVRWRECFPFFENASTPLTIFAVSQ